MRNTVKLLSVASVLFLLTACIQTNTKPVTQRDSSLTAGNVEMHVSALGREDGAGVLDVQDLQRAAEQVRKFKPKDEFDSPPHVSNLTGQRFSVTVSPRKRGPANSICKGFPSWGYYTQKRTFEVSFDDGSILVDSMNSPFVAAFPPDDSIVAGDLRFVSFTCKHVNEGSYRASNAFGATVNVERTKDVVIAFSAQNQPNGMSTSTTNYWSRKTSGDAARKLSQDVAIRVTGIVGVWPDGQNVICGVKHSYPSLDFAYDDTLDACIFKASSLTFEVINQRTGTVLYDVTTGRDRSG